MKNLYTFLTMLLVSLAAFSQNSHVVVKGYVTFANGTPAANKAVIVAIDSLATPACSQTHYKTTNASGFYIDTLTCTAANIVKVRVITYDCNSNTALVRDPQVPTSRVVEANFTLSCNPPNNNCIAAFEILRPTPPSPLIYFNSSASTGTSSTDSIIRRRWRFGDGDTLGGNAINTSHTYTQPGTYNVCLTTWTRLGCENTVCKSVAISPATYQVIVKGTLTFANGGPVANRRVNIATDSSFAGTNCFQTHSKFTNANGFYIDTLTCNSPILNVRVWTEDCNGVLINHPHHVPASGVVESNFVICNTAQIPACSTSFSFGPAANNPRNILFNSNASVAGAGDAIISRTWNFGDGVILTGNAVSPDHAYLQDGVYTVCLRTVTTAGCIKEICKIVEIRAVHCDARFTMLPLSSTITGYPIKFQSNVSTPSNGDSIRERIWKFGDGATLGGNIVDPSHTYTTAGTYNVCLVIRTYGGCSDTTCINIQVPLQGQVKCEPYFSYTPSATNNVLFNSSASTTSPGDSIIKRIWTFGDGTTLTGNVVSPLHQFTIPAMYTVCLRTISARGCEQTICKQVISANVVTNCVPAYQYQRVSPKKVNFNSSISWTPLNDSVISRQWNFGDGSPILNGNVVNPVHEFPALGVYTTCLKITTAKGCQNTYCGRVNVQDSIINTVSNDPIKIVQLYPVPASIQLNTVIWSRNNNVNATLAIYDIYGVKKWSVTKVLLQGNNFTVLPISGLPAGPYFFRVTTMYGVQSKPFYKL